jgi:opacity protein-like surface antigen
MKTLKISLLLLMTFLLTDARAQISKGSFLLGSNLSFNASNITEKNKNGNKNVLPSTYSLSVNPKLGYFVMENLSIGIDINFIYTRDTTSNSSETSSRTHFLMGPFGRYYFLLNDNLYLFFEANVGLGLTSTPELSKTLLGAGAGPGLSFFLTDNVALETMAKYNYFQTSGTDQTETINNLNMSIGMIYYFRARPGGLK